MARQTSKSPAVTPDVANAYRAALVGVSAAKDVGVEVAGEMFNRLLNGESLTDVLSALDITVQESRALCPVVDMAAWLDSHPRPIRKLLFAEKGGQR